MYFMVFQSHFGIHEGNVPASGIFLLDVRTYGEIVFPSKEATEYWHNLRCLYLHRKCTIII